MANFDLNTEQQPVRSVPESAPVVAVVDDEPVIRLGFSASLETIGYTVLTFKGGQELLDYLAEGNRPDCVVMDLRMPGLDGLETLRLVRDRFFKAPALICSANIDDDVRVQGRKLGVSDFIDKPVALKEFRERVTALLQHN